MSSIKPVKKKLKAPQSKRTLRRKCPKCNKRLSQVDHWGVQLDECPKCLGLWFDANELGRIKDLMCDTARWKEIDLWSYASKADFRASDYDCPVCETLLSELHFGNSGIALEFCINCNGAWLDHGELKAVLQQLEIDAVSTSFKDLKSHTFEQFKEIFHGKKELVEEVKDFVAAWRLLSLRFMVDHPDLVSKIQAFRRSLPF